MTGIFQAIFPHPIPFRTLEELTARADDDGKITKAMYERALSDFTRVVEETGVLDQERLHSQSGNRNMAENARTELASLKARLEILKAFLPTLHESPASLGEKLLSIADLNLRIAEFQLDHSLREPT